MNMAFAQNLAVAGGNWIHTWLSPVRATILMKFSCNCVLDTVAVGYTCLFNVAFIIQSVLISLIAATREEQPGKHLKYDGCSDECVWG